jgi:hypothetical protein
MAVEFGVGTAMQMVEQYFKLADKFINEKGHPAKLMKTNANQIIASLGNKPTVQRQKMVMRIQLACDRCGQQFEWVGDHKELEGNKLCQKCKPTKSAH